jgi:hypothetical protein
MFLQYNIVVVYHSIIIMDTPKIFVISFNKCGTQTMHWFFMKNGLKCVHWDNANIVNVFEDNIKCGRKLLENGRTFNTRNNSDCEYENMNVFSDMSKDIDNKYARDYYKILDKQYLDSKFIIATRNISDWIRSRRNHRSGNILKYQRLFHNCDDVVINDIWTKHYQDHLEDVKLYFENRPKDLLIFDLDIDGKSCEKIVKFFDGIYKLDTAHYSIVK